VHDVFSINLLEPYRKPKNPLRTIVLAEPEQIDNEENCLITGIVDIRTISRKKKVKYCVLWEGFRMEKGQRQPYKNLASRAEEALKEFHKKYSRRPRDSRLLL
jgi:hypothetical protein